MEKEELIENETLKAPSSNLQNEPQSVVHKEESV
jgi:hypothetical protein